MVISGTEAYAWGKKWESRTIYFMHLVEDRKIADNQEKGAGRGLPTRTPSPLSSAIRGTGPGGARHWVDRASFGGFRPCRAQTGIIMFSGVGIACKTPIRKALSVLHPRDGSVVTAWIGGRINSSERPTGARKILGELEVLASCCSAFGKDTEASSPHSGKRARGHRCQHPAHILQRGLRCADFPGRPIRSTRNA